MWTVILLLTEQTRWKTLFAFVCFQEETTHTWQTISWVMTRSTFALTLCALRIIGKVKSVWTFDALSCVGTRKTSIDFRWAENTCSSILCVSRFALSALSDWIVLYFYASQTIVDRGARNTLIHLRTSCCQKVILVALQTCGFIFAHEAAVEDTDTLNGFPLIGKWTLQEVTSDRRSAESFIRTELASLHRLITGYALTLWRNYFEVVTLVARNADSCIVTLSTKRDWQITCNAFLFIISKIQILRTSALTSRRGTYLVINLKLELSLITCYSKYFSIIWEITGNYSWWHWDILN